MQIKEQYLDILTAVVKRVNCHFLLELFRCNLVMLATEIVC